MKREGGALLGCPVAKKGAGQFLPLIELEQECQIEAAVYKHQSCVLGTSLT